MNGERCVDTVEFLSTLKLEIAMITLSVIVVSFSPGCLFLQTDSDPGWYTPCIISYFDSLELSSLADNLSKSNISCEYEIDHTAKEEPDPESLYITFADNIIYIFLNNTYYISEGTLISLFSHKSLGGPFMRIRLYAEKYVQYQFPSKQEAMNASYLLDPSFDLIKYFLNESSNQMPYDVRYDIW